MGRMHDMLRGLDTWLEREDDDNDDAGELAAHVTDDLFAKELVAAALICAEPDCEQPVEHPCHGCGMRLCGECLGYHALDGCADAHAAAEWCADEFALALADARETESD